MQTVDIGYLPWTKPAAFDQRPCVRDDNTGLTYGEFTEHIDALAGQLSRKLVGYGDIVAVMISPRVELLVAVFAVWRAGAVVTLVNPDYTDTEVKAQIADAEANFVINLDADSPDAGLPVLHVPDFDTEPRPESVPDNAIVDDELAIVLYASDPDSPRGVMLSHGNLMAMSSQISTHLWASSSDHGLLLSPVFHEGAALLSVLTTVLAGAQLTVTTSPCPTSFLDKVAKLKPTVIAGLPHHYEELAALPDLSTTDTSSLRLAVSGETPIPATLVDTIEQLLDLIMIEAYGRPESSCYSVVNRIDGVRKPGAVGQVVPGQSIKIVDVDGNDLPADQEGEVLISGPTVMQGYLNRPEETATTVVNGWLHTGDRGRIDEEGYLTLVGNRPGPDGVDPMLHDSATS